MSEIIRELLELAHIDEGLLSCKERLAAGPEEIKRLEAAQAAAQAAVREAEEAIRRLVARTDGITLDIRAAEAERSDQQKKVAAIKNNREYRIVTDRLQDLRADIAQNEAALLGVMGEIDRAKERVEERQAAAGAAQAALERLRAEVAAEMEAAKREAIAAKARREPQLAKIARLDPAVPALYDFALRRTRGHALAELDGGICQACHQRQNPSVIEKVTVGRDVKDCRCQGCGRILYPRIRVEA